MRTNIYIDGLNLYYCALQGSPNRWLDLEALGAEILSGTAATEIHYFTAKVVPSYPGDRAAERQNAFIRASRTLATVKVYEGYFARNTKRARLADDTTDYHNLFVPRFLPRHLFTQLWLDKVQRRTMPFTSAKINTREEKTTDVNLGVHLVRDCVLDLCDAAVVVSGDTDFVPAIKMAVESGKSVAIVNPKLGTDINRMLLRASSFELPLTQGMLDRSRLPLSLTSKRGRSIHCPQEWR
jgi:uncharacterized LabA/DUF88 family protein